MSKDHTQFIFTSHNLKKVKKCISIYPKGREGSAVMQLLHLVQEQLGWITEPSMRYIANILHIPYIRVYEVASFYTMYHLQPVGKYLIQVCTTTPCWLCNSQNIINTVNNQLGISIGETTKDNLFTLKEVECLGACIQAPVIQINKDFYEKLTSNKIRDIIIKLIQST
ncbi:NADH-quinone oxidoreductase subunit NuoE [Wolbachia endosymbiont of Howardula sp.]|uniref:NADH-quinone oxidoreductase subunit NuoE n=1 Tax=Wolbachia endosymbiont of Howardula sp. TaxID=2916816 RepID=UPI00217F05F5|nr:NADH-quinone oxidoreductase subunit NuoE [Wolbachia endosymbiont of Howardula sp.]UWI82954.1 NADH-quinone oxidoreductase subunit NuoE [Wolbachia endosymbiont of Howardula sp.]